MRYSILIHVVCYFFLGEFKNRKDTTPSSDRSTRARAVYAVFCNFTQLQQACWIHKALESKAKHVLSTTIRWNMSWVRPDCVFLFFQGPKGCFQRCSAQGQGTYSIPRHRRTPTNGVRARPFASVTRRQRANGKWPSTWWFILVIASGLQAQI